MLLEILAHVVPLLILGGGLTLAFVVVEKRQARMDDRLRKLEEYGHYHEEMTGWVKNQNFRRAHNHFGWGASKAIPVEEGEKVSNVWKEDRNIG